MIQHQVTLSQPAQDDPDYDPDSELARQLFGDAVKEPRIVNAELGIFPVEDDE